MDVPDKLRWKANWSKEDIRRITDRAKNYRMQGMAYDDSSAWYAAEMEYLQAVTPYSKNLIRDISAREAPKGEISYG